MYQQLTHILPLELWLIIDEYRREMFTKRVKDFEERFKDCLLPLTRDNPVSRYFEPAVPGSSMRVYLMCSPYIETGVGTDQYITVSEMLIYYRKHCSMRKVTFSKISTMANSSTEHTYFLD